VRGIAFPDSRFESAPPARDVEFRETPQQRGSLLFNLNEALTRPQFT